MFALGVLVYAVVLCAFVAFCTKKVKLSTAFFVLVLASLPLWMGQIEGWFRWAKYLSVFLPVIVLGLSRIAVKEEKSSTFWAFFASKRMLIFFHAMIFLNILEATLKDVSLGNYFNAFAGVVLCLTIPLAPKRWRFAKEAYGEIIAYTPFFWSFLYSTWNACFVYAESPMYFAGSATILSVAFLIPVFYKRPELYIHARVYTLSLHLLLRATFDFFPKVMDATPLFSASVLGGWGIVNTVIAGIYVLWHFGMYKNKEALSHG